VAATPSAWAAPSATAPVHARVSVPGSKSQASRALVLAALADGAGTVHGAPWSRDTQLMVDGLAQLGVCIARQGPDVLEVRPPRQGLSPAADGIDTGLAGTVLRFLPPVAALAPGLTCFRGDERASLRPLRPLLDALEQLGVQVHSQTGSVPFSMDVPGTLGGPEVSIDSSASSQFVSGLLLAGARFPAGLDLRHVGQTVPSAPHIAMTVQMLADHGVRVEMPEPNRWIVHPGPVSACDVHLEPDLTNAAAFLAAGVLTGGHVEVPTWPDTTTQPGDQIRGVLEAFGARADLEDGTARAACTGPLRGIDIDLHEASELTPVVAGLAAFAGGQTTITGVGHIRGHETDRIAAIAETLTAVGVEVRETPDGLVIRGAAAAQLHPAALKSFGDHRMVHLAALLGLMVPGVTVDDVGATAKTMPDFPQRWAAMIAGRAA